jgi:hypothetical protein
MSWPGVARRQVTFLVSPRKVTKEKATPLIPETPEIEPAGWAAKNSPCRAVLIFVFCSRTQTPLPLIHPPDSISGGAERGGKSKPG